MEQFELVCRRVEGLTPAERAQMLAEELDKLRSGLSNLLTEIDPDDILSPLIASRHEETETEGKEGEALSIVEIKE